MNTVALHPLLLIQAAFGQEADEIALSDAELIILFSVAIAVVLSLILYITRDIILRRRTDYDRSDASSKRNRDYEKYHSGWNEEYGIGERTRTGKRLEEEASGGKLEDYYVVLGVARNAELHEIKRRFRELAKEMHPDKSSGDSKDMARINRAYEVLSDTELRERYDQLLGHSNA